MPRTPFIVIACAAVLAASAGVSEAAAPPQPTPPPVGAEIDPLKAPFEALAEQERRALQDALVWTGDFTGAVAGTYGPRTREALLAYGRRAGLAGAAVLGPGSRERILADAIAARRGVGFASVRDSRAGLTIGLPLRLLAARTPVAGGTRYAAPDDSVVVDTLGRDTGPDGLTDVFARLTRDQPGRRVTYKLARPDFIVVAGETGDHKFYSRYALATSSDGVVTLRGFTMSYAQAATDLDRIVLAVAASFDPAPTGAVGTPAAQPKPGVAAPVPAPPAVKPATLAGEAVLVGPGTALTRADPAHCAAPEVGGVPAAWSRQDAGTGLALLTLPDHADAPSIALSTGAAAPARVLSALFMVADRDRGAVPVLSVGSATLDAPTAVRVALQGADAGVVIVGGDGGLAGLVGSRRERPPVRVGGVALEARYDIADAGQISTFLSQASVQTDLVPAETKTTVDPVQRWRAVILPLTCRSAAAGQP